MIATQGTHLTVEIPEASLMEKTPEVHQILEIQEVIPIVMIQGAAQIAERAFPAA